MAMYYSDPEKRSEWSLPDVEVLYVHADEITPETVFWPEDDPPADPMAWEGWYWRFCFPSCMPESDPSGPFDSEDEAVADMRKCAKHSADDLTLSDPYAILPVVSRERITP